MSRQLDATTETGRIMLQQASLLVGIASVAACLGYMAGGSGTPVASVAIPAVFGLVVTALGLLQAAQPSKDLLEYLKATGDKADSQPDMVEYRNRTRSAPGRIGLALIAFSVAYLAAATLGAKVRIDGLLAPQKGAGEFPWQTNDTKPPTIVAALEWMALQSRLSELGYSTNRIAVLYEIQVLEWKRLATQAQVAAGVPGQGDPVPRREETQSTGAEELRREWLKQGAGKGNVNPFANQPSKEWIEKLKDLRAPGSTTSGVLPG